MFSLLWQLYFTVTSISSNLHAAGAYHIWLYLPSPYKTLLTTCVEQEKKKRHFQTLACFNLVTPELWKLGFCLTLYAPVVCMIASDTDTYFPLWVVLSGSSLCSIFKITFFLCLVDVVLKISLILSILFNDLEALSLLVLTGLLCGIKENTGAISFGVCLVIVINNSCFHYLETDRLICLPTITLW